MRRVGVNRFVPRRVACSLWFRRIRLSLKRKVGWAVRTDLIVLTRGKRWVWSQTTLASRLCGSGPLDALGAGATVEKPWDLWRISWFMGDGSGGGDERRFSHAEVLRDRIEPGLRAEDLVNSLNQLKYDREL